jgi:hypothetical protein
LEFLESCGADDAEKRIRLIQSDNWIGYANARNIVDQVDDLIKMERVTRMRGMLVLGATDNGKTSIRKRIEAKHQVQTTANGKMNIPVLSIQMPPAPNDRSFYNAILKGMMLPTFPSGKVDHIKDCVIGHLLEYDVRLIMIDEIQHIDRIPARKQRLILDIMKYISNEISLPMVAFGTTEALNVFRADPQLDNRFKKIYLKRWELDEDFLRLLVSIEQLLPLREASELGQEELATLIYGKTNGTIGEIVTLIRGAAIQAIKTGKEKITPQVLEEVNFESVIYNFVVNH